MTHIPKTKATQIRKAIERGEDIVDVAAQFKISVERAQGLAEALIPDRKPGERPTAETETAPVKKAPAKKAPAKKAEPKKAAADENWEE